MASKSISPSSLSMTLGLTMHGLQQCFISVFQKAPTPSLSAPWVFSLTCAYAPHVLANDVCLIIMQYPYRASESSVHEENPERRELDMKSPSPEYTGMHSNRSSTPDRPRYLQTTERPECTLKGSSRFAILVLSFSARRIVDRNMALIYSRRTAGHNMSCHLSLVRGSISIMTADYRLHGLGTRRNK